MFTTHVMSGVIRCVTTFAEIGRVRHTSYLTDTHTNLSNKHGAIRYVEIFAEIALSNVMVSDICYAQFFAHVRKRPIETQIEHSVYE